MSASAEANRVSVGLVAPLPPQVGGVVSVAVWLLNHEPAMECTYATFDLWRPEDGSVGGRFQLRAVGRQLRLTVLYLRWLRTAPQVLHYCVSCSVVGLSRDLLFIALARASRRRVIAHIHGSEFATSASAPFFQIPALKLLRRFSRERVTITPWAHRELQAHGIDSLVVANPILVRPTNGLNPPPPAVRGGVRLLFVGSYGRLKGCELLVDAIARARAEAVDASLRFVGKEMYDGEEASLRDRVDRRGLVEAVDFAGAHPAEHLSVFYSAADVICLPSRREVLPLSLLEGMAHGLPALASTAGGIPDIVDDGRTGILVEWGDLDGLVDAIRFFAEDADRREAMGQAARERALSLTAPGRIAAQWRELYSRIAAQPT
jgi:glycosyltransferase involved in cell wall biosynthesis